MKDIKSRLENFKSGIDKNDKTMPAILIAEILIEISIHLEIYGILR